MSNVLIIEDDHNLREGLELLFQIEGYTTLGTSNGDTGIELIRREKPDIVLTNFQMPGADGLDVLRAVRSEGDHGTTVIFLTANHRPSLREQAVREGADAFLTKPFDTDELLRTVASFAPKIGHEESP
jgi:DNA-binding response OmpR family regulator